MYWLYIKDRLKDHTGLATQLLLLLLGIYVYIMADKQILWKAPLLFVGLLCWFLLRNKTKLPILWILGLILLIIDLRYSYFWVANHHFMLLFVVLSIIMYICHKREDILHKNIQVLLVIVVLTSVIQKLMSSQFMSGDFYYYMMNRGTFFRYFMNFFPESLEAVKSNQQALLELHDTDPSLTKQIILIDVVQNLKTISPIYAWITVAIEFFVAAALLWKPRSTWTHLLFIVMILCILSARLETGFMSLLAICGLFLCKNYKLRLLYIMISVACLTFIITKVGYH